MPLRDGRRGRRATLPGGQAPLALHFEQPPDVPNVLDVPPPAELLPELPPEDATARIAELTGGHRSSRDRFAVAVTAFDPLTPFATAWRSIVRCFGATAPARVEEATPAAGAEHAAGGSTADPQPERTFAAELAALLERPAAAAIEELGADPPAPASSLPATDASTSVSALPSSAAQEARPAGEPAALALVDVRDTHANETLADDGGPSAAEMPFSKPAQEIVVSAAAQTAFRRMAPLTRLPLRQQALPVTWPNNVEGGGAEALTSRTERHALLERLARERGTVSRSLLEAAYSQEDAAGRAIALRAVLQQHPHDGRALFCAALRTGSDDERSIAIDALGSLDARQELTAAFGDRLTPLAAKAALAYVGTFAREDYRAALSPFMDDARIDAILALLAGVVE